MTLRFTAFLFAIALAACSPEAEDTRPGQPVKHRQEAFTAMLNAYEPIGVMLDDIKQREKPFSLERFSKLKEKLASADEGPWAYFGADTNYPPSKSQPEVWTEPEKFEAEKQRFLAASAKLRAAEELETIQSAYKETRASCKSCHDIFRRR
ncbi:MAG: cytochrome c [Azoarcus sp.]|jgi:cytochrome c556|nr:cytochrome c [Azoarcus sp.]